MINVNSIAMAARTLVGDKEGVTFTPAELAQFVQFAVDEYNIARPMIQRGDFTSTANVDLYAAPVGCIEVTRIIQWGPTYGYLQQFFNDLSPLVGVPSPLGAYSRDAAAVAAVTDETAHLGARGEPILRMEWSAVDQAYMLRMEPMPTIDGQPVVFEYSKAHTADANGNYPSLPSTLGTTLTSLVQAYMEEAIALELEKAGVIQSAGTTTNPTTSIKSLRTHAAGLRADVASRWDAPVVARG